MKLYQTNEIKNIALLGNDGSGKTTLTESLLYEAGIIQRRGRVSQGTTVSDYFPVEQDYGYSVFSTVYHVEYNNKKLNIIDCPGSDDFVGAAITALNVTDTAVLLLNGQYGPEVGKQKHEYTSCAIPQELAHRITSAIQRSSRNLSSSLSTSSTQRSVTIIMSLTDCRRSTAQKLSLYSILSMRDQSSTPSLTFSS